MKDLTRNEFDHILLRSGYRKAPSEETIKVRQLEVGQGFVVPCRWKHSVNENKRGTGSCSGMVRMHNAARPRRKLNCRCWEKNLYVMRVG